MEGKKEIFKLLESLNIEFIDKNLSFRISELDISSYRRKKIKTELQKIEKHIGEPLPKDIYNLYKQFNGFGFSWIDGGIKLESVSSIINDINNKKSIWKKAEVDTLPLFVSRTLNIYFEIRFKIINGVVKLFFGHIDWRNDIIHIILKPLTWNYFDLITNVIKNKGCLLYMFFDFVYPNLNQEYKQLLLLEIQEISKKKYSRSTKWQDYIDSYKDIEGLNIYALGSDSALKSQYRFVFEHILGFPPKQSIVRFFAETDGRIELSYSTKGISTNSFSIWHWSRFLSNEALVYRYLKLQDNNIDVAFHQYRVLVYKEFPIFINLDTDSIELYRYDYSTKSIDKIELDFDIFMSKLFEYYGVENWEILFIESFKNLPYREDVLKAIKENHPKIDLSNFKNGS